MLKISIPIDNHLTSGKINGFHRLTLQEWHCQFPFTFYNKHIVSTCFNQTVHFAGTMQHIDESQWHDLLAQAAAPKPDVKGKDGTTTAGKK